MKKITKTLVFAFIISLSYALYSNGKNDFNKLQQSINASKNAQGLISVSCEGCNLSNAPIKEKDMLSGGFFKKANFSGSNLEKADFLGSHLSGANLSGSTLTDADLSQAEIADADLSNSNLSQADLSDSTLSKANLSGANLTDADLSGADLSGANLSGANLTGASLNDANLTQTNLSGAIFDNTDISGAFFSNTNVTGIPGLLCSITNKTNTDRYLSIKHGATFYLPANGQPVTILWTMHEVDEQEDPQMRASQSVNALLTDQQSSISGITVPLLPGGKIYSIEASQNGINVLLHN